MGVESRFGIATVNCVALGGGSSGIRWHVLKLRKTASNET